MGIKKAACLTIGLVSMVRALQEVDLVRRFNGSVDDYLNFESPIASEGVFKNIAPNGTNAEGGKPGIVVASPYKVNPDYFYTWTRDSALTFKYLMDSGNATTQLLLEDYVLAQASLQQLDNPSGGFANGSGLGEPKFYLNETAFLESWGRPQRDGPALRATAMMAFGKTRIGLNQAATVKDVVWPIVRNDLAYVAQYWNQSGFDLWEEVNGSSFFTTAVQYRALVEGSAFAKLINETCDDCDTVAPSVGCHLQEYWNGKSIVGNIAVSQEGFNRSGLDCSSLLTSIHIFDPAAGCDSNTFQPCSEKALSNHKAVVDAFRANFTINDETKAGQGAAIGRYPEDFYQGGNPWYLCTFAAAEQLYDAAYVYQKNGVVNVTDLSKPFFDDLVANLDVGSYKSGSDQFKSITSALMTYADGFAAMGAKYTPSNGSLAEQFSRENGTALSAGDLTWSYVSLLTMQRARSGIISSGWGASPNANIPTTCSASPSTVVGTYVKPSATAFPQSEEGTYATNTTGSGSGTTTTTGTAAPTKTHNAGHKFAVGSLGLLAPAAYLLLA